MRRILHIFVRLESFILVAEFVFILTLRNLSAWLTFDLGSRSGLGGRWAGRPLPGFVNFFHSHPISRGKEDSCGTDFTMCQALA